mmetsp:Transcript_34151/g.77371  ORF Transcript_34151/g.77371 Transcript_34151/m.77371 type:complete len:208 (-) Transcript_34151:61-684(-)
MRGATRDRGDAVAARVFTDTYGVRDGRERLPVEFYVATSPASMVKLTVSISHSPPPPQLSPSLAAQSPASSLLMSSLGASPLLSAPVSPPLAPFRPSTSPPASALFLHPMKLLLALTVLLICCCSFVRLRRKRTRQYELSSCSSNDVSEVIPPSWDVRRGCHAMPYVWGDDSLRGEGMVKQAAGLELPHGSAPSQIVGRCEYEEFEI